MAENLAEQVRQTIVALDVAATALARQGWTIPMHMTPAETFALLQDASGDGLDARFVEWYESEDYAGLIELKAGLSQQANLEPWRGLLGEVFEAYRRQHFAITVPALLTVIEGCIATQPGDGTNVRALVRRRLDSEMNRWPDSVTALIWRSIATFCDQLFMPTHFAAGRPSRINRHWILHGRDTGPWNKADALRLVQAVDTVSRAVALGSNAAA